MKAKSQGGRKGRNKKKKNAKSAKRNGTATHQQLQRADARLL